MIMARRRSISRGNGCKSVIAMKDRRMQISEIEPVEFPRFKDFPTEIRLLIWKFALSGPRVVLLEPRVKSAAHGYCYRVRSDVHVDDFRSFFTGTLDGLTYDHLSDLVKVGQIGPLENDQKDIFFHSCCPRPVILDVCFEAYQAASMFYERAFGTVWGFPQVWFDYNVDSLFLDWGDGRIMTQYKPSSFSDEDLKRVQNLVLYERQSRLEGEEYESAESWVAEVLQSFTGVKKITRSVFGGDCKHQGHAIFLKDPIPAEIQEYWVTKNLNPTGERDFLDALRGGVFTSVPLDLEKLKFEMELKTKGSQLPDGEAIVQARLPLPEVEYKIAMSPEFKAQLDAGERQYWEGVERGEIIRIVEVEAD